MATMNVGMTLTLADAASGPLRAFTALIEQLEAAASRLTPRLAAAAAELSRFVSPAATGNVTELTASIGRLEGQLSGLTGALASAAAGFGAMGAAAATSGTAMRESLAATNAEALTLSGTLRGMAALWAAVKIEQGLKGSVSEAADFQRTENRLTNMQTSPEDNAAIRNSVAAVSRDFHQFNKNELLEMILDLRQVTGSAHEASEGLGGFAKAVFAINLSLPNGQKLGQQDTLNLGKILELLGKSTTEQDRTGALSEIAQIVAATQGRVNPANLFGNLTYAKGGLGRIMGDDPDTLRAFAAIVEEDSIGGGSGGRAGTMVSSFVNSITKNSAVTTKNRQEWMKLGLLDPNKVTVNETTDQVTKVGAGAIVGAETAGKFKKWVDTYLRVALERAGIDLDNPEAIKAKTDILFPNRNASELAFQVLTRKSLMEKQMAMVAGTAGTDTQVENGLKLATAQMEQFHKSVDDLAITIGTTLLPAVTEIAKVFGEWLRDLTAFFEDHPVVAQFAALAAVIGTVALAAAGLAALFGSAGVVAAFGGLSTVIGVVIGWFGTFAAVVVGILGGPITLLIGAIALVVVAWRLGIVDWLADLTVGGARIGTWATNLADSVSTTFQNMWIRTRAFFGFLSDDAAAAQIGANNAAQAGRLAGQNYGNEGRRVAPDPFSTRAIDFGKGEGWDAAPRARAAGAGSAGGAGGGGGGRAGRATKADYLGAIQGEGAGQEQAKVNFLRSEKAVYGELGKMEADQAKESAKLDKDKLDLERELLLTSGQRHASEALRAEQEIAAKVQALLLSHRITQEEADNFLARAHAATELKLRTEEIGKIQSAYADRLADTQNAERNGMLSQTASEDEILRLRKEEAKVLDEEIAKQLALAEAAGDEVTLLRLEKQQRQNDAVSGQLPSDQIQILKSAQAGFGNFFNSILSHTKSVKDAFRDLGHSILDTINQVVSKRLGDALFDSLFGAFFGQQGGATGAGLGGSSGLGAMFGGLFGGLFGGGSANAAGGAASAGFGTGAGFGNLDFGGFFASGIDNVPNDMLAVIHKGERVVTAADNARGGGGRMQVNHINVSPPAGMSKQSATQLGATIAKQIEMAGRRNN